MLPKVDQGYERYSPDDFGGWKHDVRVVRDVSNGFVFFEIVDWRSRDIEFGSETRTVSMKIWFEWAKLARECLVTPWYEVVT